VKTKKPPKVRNGQRIRPHLTVVAALDPGSRDPVHVVWNHRALCPMACKLFASATRARQETAILVSLAHPNIVRCLGLEAGRSMPACLLMEYLEGQTLRQFLRTRGNRQISISDAMRLTIHLCAALAHMHGRGILHLDVKPSNIIVTHGRPVLFDFGVARKKAEWDARIFGGSDLYMPPEQCGGAPVTPASDIYSLGLTLYELLTGELPFSKPTRRRKYPQLHEAPRPARELRKQVPRALDDLIMTCLAADPRQRPQDAVALVQPLHRFIGSGSAMWPAIVEP
jgi:eukaryotic-like serine/threonine-protein kinase